MTAKRKNAKNGIIWKILPSGGDKPAEFLRKAVLLLSLTIIIVFVIILINLCAADGTNSEEQLRRDALIAAKEEADKNPFFLSGTAEIPAEKAEEKEPLPPVLDEYKDLYAANKDLVGYVNIEGSLVDYPVMQTKDNEYYLYHDFERADSKLGCIFADYHYPITDKRPDNTILYGHNISAGTYFAGITNYYPNKYGGMGFYNAHPTVDFDTIYEKGTYKVFAVIFTNTMEEHGEVYEYFTKTRFSDRGEFYDFVGNIMDRSAICTDVDLQYGDEILTLSTCYYPFGMDVDTRIAVFARRVRDGESAEVDTSLAYRNPSIKYFDFYYRVMGDTWSGRKWDTTKVEGFDEYMEKNGITAE